MPLLMAAAEMCGDNERGKKLLGFSGRGNERSDLNTSVHSPFLPFPLQTAQGCPGVQNTKVGRDEGNFCPFPLTLGDF